MDLKSPRGARVRSRLKTELLGASVFKGAETQKLAKENEKRPV